MVCEKERRSYLWVIWKHAFPEWSLRPAGYFKCFDVSFIFEFPLVLNQHFPENSLLVSLLDEWVSCSLHVWVQSPCGWQTAPSPCLWGQRSVLGTVFPACSGSLTCVLPTVALWLECPTQSSSVTCCLTVTSELWVIILSLNTLLTPWGDHTVSC